MSKKEDGGDVNKDKPKPRKKREFPHIDEEAYILKWFGKKE